MANLDDTVNQPNPSAPELPADQLSPEQLDRVAGGQRASVTEEKLAKANEPEFKTLEKDLGLSER